MSNIRSKEHSFREAGRFSESQRRLAEGLQRETLSYFAGLPGSGDEHDLVKFGNSFVALGQHDFSPSELVQILKHIASFVSEKPPPIMPPAPFASSSEMTVLGPASETSSVVLGHTLEGTQNLPAGPEMAFGADLRGPPGPVTPIDINADALIAKQKADRADAHFRQQKQFRHDCHDLIAAHFSIFETKMGAYLGGAKSGDLSELLNALATLPLRPSVAFMGALQAALTKQLQKGAYNNADLSHCLLAFNRLGIRPEDSLLNAWQEQVTQKMPDAHAGNLADRLLCFANLRMRPSPDLMRVIKERIDRMLENGNPSTLKEAATILKPLATLDCLGLYDGAEDLARAIDSRIRHAGPATFKRAIAHQIHQTRSWFQWPSDSDEQQPDIPEQQSRSRTEEQFADMLAQNANLTVDRAGFVITDMGHTIDLAVDDHAQKILIEIDGPMHFLYTANKSTGRYDAGDLNGRTMFQTAMIRMYEPDKALVRVPFWTCARMERDPLWASRNAQEMVRQVHKHGAGAYIFSENTSGLILDDLSVARQRKRDPQLKKKKNSGEFSPVTEELIRGMKSEQGGNPEVLRFIKNAHNLARRAGFALGTEYPAPEDQAPFPDEEWRASPLMRLRYEAGYNIAVAIAGTDDPKILRDKFGVRKPKLYWDFQMPVSPEALAAFKTQLQEYFKAPLPEKVGFSSSHQMVWERSVLDFRELTVDDIAALLASVSVNIAAIKEPAAKTAALNYMAQHMHGLEPFFIRGEPLSGVSFVGILKAMHTMGMQPSSRVWACLQKSAIAGFGHFDDAARIETACLMAELALAPSPDFIETLASKMVSDDLAKITQVKDRMNLLWASAVLNALTGSRKFSEIGSALHASLVGKHLPAQRDYRLAHACLWFDKEPLVVVTPACKPAQAVFKTRMRAAFLSAGELLFDRPIVALKTNADLAFKQTTAAGMAPQEIVIQIDDSGNLLRRTDMRAGAGAQQTLNGFALLQSAVTAKAEQQILFYRILGADGQTLTNSGPEMQQKIAAKIAEESARAKQGAYALIFNQAGAIVLEPVTICAPEPRALIAA